MEVVVDSVLISCRLFRVRKQVYIMFWSESAMLLWLVFCLEIMLALEDLSGDLWFSSRENPNVEACWVMLSFDVSRCAGDICKTYVN